MICSHISYLLDLTSESNLQLLEVSTDFRYFTVLPLQAESYSRRIAYLSFIMCAYVVHCFYTSNLLSHLVNDADVVMDLETLVKSDYKIALLKDMNIVTDRKVRFNDLHY